MSAASSDDVDDYMSDAFLVESQPPAAAVKRLQAEGRAAANARRAQEAQKQTQKLSQKDVKEMMADRTEEAMQQPLPKTSM